MDPSIFSLEQLKESLTSFQKEVVCCLCENTADLKQLESMLRHLGISYDLDCPFPPYHQDGDVEKVRKERRGEYKAKSDFFPSKI